MDLKIVGVLGRQASAGAVVGLSAVIYSLSYAALLFSGPLAAHVGFGITVALISATIGALFGAFSEEKTFVAGPDSNTISVMASMLVVSGSIGFAGMAGVNLAVAMIVATSALSGLAFYLVARANLSGLVRYIPFPVMAGFLTSTGWLMAGGAMNIIAGTPFSMAGLHAFLADPFKPQLGFGLLVVACLYGLSRFLSSALLIPIVMGLATLAVNLVLASPYCAGGSCHPEAWLFPKLGAVQWLPIWNLDWAHLDYRFMLHNLPAMLVVSFVGLLTILLSVASLELNFHREFALNKVLKTHAAAGGVAALLGGFLPIISIGRTTVSRQTGGGIFSCFVSAAICLAMLLGAGNLIAYVPKAALGALVLYLGLNMMKQWLWDSRATTPRFELVQILSILALVANFGFMAGFAAGVVMSCVAFIVTYSRIPLTSLTANIALLPSSAVRPAHETELLRDQGEKILVYRLGGYIFFGSASKIADMFGTVRVDGDDGAKGIILDFANVSGIDSSAISVFQRIISRFKQSSMRFYCVYAESNEATVRRIAPAATSAELVQFFPSLDRAIESAEEHLIAVQPPEAPSRYASSFFDDEASQAVFFAHCDLRDVPRGELLCAEGDESDALFFVESGELEVVKAIEGAAPVRLAKLYPGAMVGELAFYTGEARSASIVAATDSRIYVLSRASFTRLREAHPDLATRFDHIVIGKLSKTLQRTNKLLTLYR